MLLLFFVCRAWPEGPWRILRPQTSTFVTFSPCARSELQTNSLYPVFQCPAWPSLESVNSWSWLRARCTRTTCVLPARWSRVSACSTQLEETARSSAVPARPIGEPAIPAIPTCPTIPTSPDELIQRFWIKNSCQLSNWNKPVVKGHKIGLLLKFSSKGSRRKPPFTLFLSCLHKRRLTLKIHSFSVLWEAETTEDN